MYLKIKDGNEIVRDDGYPVLPNFELEKMMRSRYRKHFGKTLHTIEGNEISVVHSWNAEEEKTLAKKFIDLIERNPKFFDKVDPDRHLLGIANKLQDVIMLLEGHQQIELAGKDITISQDQMSHGKYCLHLEGVPIVGVPDRIVKNLITNGAKITGKKVYATNREA